MQQALSNCRKTVWKSKSPEKIALSGRELSPQVTEGASGVKAGCLRMGWYLLVVIDNPTSTAVTIPGGSGK